MTTGKSVALGTALLMGIALAVAGPAPAAQFDQRTFDVPADRLFQLVLAAAEGRFELKRVNEPIRVVAEAREISSGAKLALEVDAAGETAARVRITAGNQSEKSRAAMRAMLGELERRVQEQHQFATVGSTTSVTPDQVRQITEWTHSYPPNVDQYRTGRYDVPIKHGSSKTTVRTLLTVLTPYLRVALSAHGASASLKALSPDSLSAETLAPLVQVLAEPYDKGPSFHPVFRYLTADHMVILPPGSRDASQAT